MREFGAIMTKRLDDVKREVFQQKTAIDSDFPEWPARRKEFGADYVRYEARREVFVTIVTLIENAQLSYLLLRDHLTNDAWWQERLEAVSEDKRDSVLHEYAIMVKWFLLHGPFSAIEETLRAIQRAAPEDMPVRGKYKSIARVTKSVLAASAAEKFSPLFRLVRFTRNTLHTNGIFLPEDQKDVPLEYEGEIFDFKVGEPLNWLGDQRAVWFVQELARAINVIVRSDVVRAIEYCPRTEILKS